MPKSPKTQTAKRPNAQTPNPPKPPAAKRAKTSPAKAPKKRSIYGVHPGVKMVADWIESLPSKTGRSLQQWVSLVRAEGPEDEKGRREWLKEMHGFGTNAAWWIAERSVGKGLHDGDPDMYLKEAEKYLVEMYAGGKAGLKPIHDALIDAAAELGDDVKACPCQTIVPLYRNHVFAQIKPSTKTRIDLGLALAKFEGKLPARLIDTGGKAKGDRITHRIPITKLDEIDDEVKQWLKVAYDLDQRY